MLPGDITALLKRMADGDASAEDRLLRMLFHELRRMAARHLRHERPGHTLQPTDLLNEVFVRVMRSDKPPRWNDRGHFFAVASTAMRRVLVDHARRRAAAKRGATVTIDDLGAAADALSINHHPERIIAVDSALTELARLDPRQARIVEMRFFIGIPDDEIAVLLGISRRTVMRDWAAAKSWLYARLAPGDSL